MLHTLPPDPARYEEFLAEQGIEPEKIPDMAKDLADTWTGFDFAYCSEKEAADATVTLRETGALPGMPADHAIVIKVFQLHKWLLVANPSSPTYTLRIHGVDQLVTTDQAAAVAAYNEAEPQSYLLTMPELRDENRPPRQNKNILSEIIDEQRRQKRQS